MFEQLTGLGGLTGQSALWLETSPAHRKSALGTVSSAQGACVGGRDKRNQRVAYCLTPFWNSRVALVGTKTAAEQF